MSKDLSRSGRTLFHTRHPWRFQHRGPSAVRCEWAAICFEKAAISKTADFWLGHQVRDLIERQSFSEEPERIDRAHIIFGRPTRSF